MADAHQGRDGVEFVNNSHVNCSKFEITDLLHAMCLICVKCSKFTDEITYATCLNWDMHACMSRMRLVTKNV